MLDVVELMIVFLLIKITKFRLTPTVAASLKDQLKKLEANFVNGDASSNQVNIYYEFDQET